MTVFKILISVLIVLISGLSQVKSQTSEQLEKAYANNSTKKLKEFFDDWAKDLPPANAKERRSLSYASQLAYGVFEGFYNPHDIAGRGGSEYGNDLYNRFNYFVIKDQLMVYQKDKVYYDEEEAKAYAIENIRKNVETKHHEKYFARVKEGDKFMMEGYGPHSLSLWEDKDKIVIDTLTDFRPNITETNAIPLYLTKKYNMLLDGFLGNKHLPLGTGGIMNPAKAKDESAKRQEFLQNYIKIAYGHWGGYWQYYTDPSIDAIVFDKDMKYAMVYYRIIYEGGEAVLKNEGGKWKLLSMKRTWIQ